MVIVRAAGLLLIAASSMFSQLAAPNAQGVSMGHIHLNTVDPAVQKTFWTEIIGAQPYEQNTLSGVTVPGAIILFRKSSPKGPSPGSSVNHIGFIVPNLEPFYAKVDKAGYKHFKPSAAVQIMIEGPDGVRVELTEDKSSTVPLRFHHIHFNTPQPKEIQAWYFERFGAVPGKRLQWEAGDIPGANLTYAQADAVAPTAGRAIDHIGFEIKDLEAFCKKLTDSGVKLDTPYRRMPQLGLALAFLTDPWGTRIELTEGLAK
ncbi:MAG TPA: VOC family protein [Bryobacteraceae bacterium]|nr:VOC family protein [Bryobacteraceae bacterium]